MKGYRKNRSLKKILLGLIFVIIGSFAITYFSFDDAVDPNQALLQSKKGAPGDETDPKEPLTNPQDQSVITTQTKIIYETNYTECGHATTDANNDDLVGLNENSVKEVFNGWDVASFNTDKVVLSQSKPGLCPECSNHFYIGEKDGHIAIYYGVPGRGTVVKKQTDIPLSALSTDLQTKIKAGIPVKSEEEGLMMLESIEY